MRRAATITITTMTTITTTTDRAALLHLQAWLSPAFPTGGFAYSHGLEWAIEAGDVTDGDSLLAWVADVLAHGSFRSDAILLRHAYRSAADPTALRAIAELALAATPSRERRDEALNQGRAFLLAVAAWLPDPLPDDLPYAVAVGAAAGRHAIPEDATTAAYLQACAASMISAAVRAVPLREQTHRPARSGRVGTDHPGDRRSDHRRNARRHRRVRVSLRPCRDAAQKPNAQGCSAHEQISAWPIARRRRRARRHRWELH